MSSPKTAMQISLIENVSIPSGNVILEGELKIPYGATGLVLFAHGSGSSRHSPRNKYVAQILREARLGTLLFDLLTEREESLEGLTGCLRFDIDLLTKRLADATDWVMCREGLPHYNIGYFGASTGGAAALVAAALLGDCISAVVSRGGRPDLAGQILQYVKSPTLLIVGGYDGLVFGLNQKAYEKLQCEKELRIVHGASHLFEEPGKMKEVARLAAEWFQMFL
jgi:putative phosphoribosyl transferase